MNAATRRTQTRTSEAGAGRAAARRLDVVVQYGVPRRGLPHPSSIRRFAAPALGRAANITVRLVGMREGRALNRQYRGRDDATNVLTFIYDASPRAPLTGDIVLCVPVVVREAHEQSKELSAHYAHLIVHGILHLQGYDHVLVSAAARMEALETRILARLGYADPYQ